MADRVAAADMLVAPSLSGESFGVVLLEAMAAGTAVLASDIGGHTELIDDGQTGVLFKTESAESLVEQAARLAAQPDLRRHVADNARRFIEQERTWDRIVGRYLPVYRGGA